MSEISPTNARLSSTITDSNAGQSRVLPPPPVGENASAGTAPVDTVELSAAAQATTNTSAPASDLSDAEAHDTATGLREALGQFGLSASARQNTAILALIRSAR